MIENRKLPERLCVACRLKKQKKDLIRIVKNKDGKIFVDQSGKADGRGAYICPDEKCFRLARKKKILQKNLKFPVPEEIYSFLDNMLK